MEMLIDIASGTQFPLLPLAENTVGRKDPTIGIYPDVDLFPVDPQHTVSPRHARILRRGRELFFLAREVGVQNSTFVNGTKLEDIMPVEFHSGDTLRFGAVELRFQVT